MVDAYYPQSLQDALEIRKDHSVIPYAGGTDLMVRENHENPFLFIGGLEELQKIDTDGDRLVLGGACTYAELLKDSRLPEALRKAVEGVAAPAIRNLGTIGGNICNASPAGDTLPVLYAMNAEVVLESSSGKETLRIEDFITGVKKTRLKETQLLTRILIPADHSGYSYTKMGARKSLAISKLVFAGVHQMDKGIIKDVGIAFGAVGPTILRSREAEQKIIGCSREELDIPSILREYEKLIHPIDDQRSTAEYRKKTCLNLLKEYLSTGL